MRDPSRERQRAAIIAACAARAITIRQRGEGYELEGVGVHVLCADLADLAETDLTPIERVSMSNTTRAR